MSFINGGQYSAVQRILTSAEVLALDATAIELLPAKTGCVYVPVMISVHKPAGTGYTAADLVLENPEGIQFTTIEGVGFLDASEEAASVQIIGGGEIREMGAAVQLRLLTATATGDQDIRVKLYYAEEYPGLL